MDELDAIAAELDQIYRLASHLSRLFPAPEGGRIEINNFRHRSWTPSLAAAGIKHRRIYGLRHTHAT